MLRYILLLLIFYFPLQAQSPAITKWYNKIANEKDEVKKCEHINRLSFAFLREGLTDSAHFYAQRARAIAKKAISKTEGYKLQKWKVQLALSYNYEGATFSNEGNLNKAIVLLDTCMLILKPIIKNDTLKDAKLGYGYANINYGNVLEQRGEYPKALRAHFEALRIFENLNDKRNIAACYHNIAIVYGNQKNLNEALSYYNKALALNKSRHDTEFIINNYSTLGTHYILMRDFNKSKECIDSALSLANIIGDVYSAMTCYANLGVLYMDLQDVDKAIVYYKKTLEILQQFEDLIASAGTSINIGEAYRMKGDLSNAEKYILQGIQWAKESGMAEYQYNGYFQLSELYSNQKKFEKSLIAYKSFVQIKDSLLNADNIRKGTEEKMNYEFDKKEALAKIEQEKKEIANAAEKKQQQIIVYSLSFGLFLMLSLAIVIFRSLQINKRKNRIITQQKEMVEEKQKEILDSIRYAKRIQNALIPSDSYMLRQLNRLR
jgi:tetratricopeptide (TPR) repeat protein